jgi:uncharacterized membrane protein (UPF0127 family)
MSERPNLAPEINPENRTAINKTILGIAILALTALGIFCSLLLGVIGLANRDNLLVPTSPVSRSLNSTDFRNASVVRISREGATEAITAEVASSPAARERGLMDRRELAADRGMLFVFPSESIPGFWMKDTYLSLDLIFIDATGTISDIYRNTKPLDTEKTYSPSEPVLYALEVKAGTAAKLNYSVGDKLIFSAE